MSAPDPMFAARAAVTAKKIEFASKDCAAPLYQSRRRGLDAMRAALEEKVATETQRLRDEIQAHADAAQKALADAEVRAEQAHAALSATLAKDAITVLDRVLLEWDANPRAAAKNLGTEWRSLDARAVSELGSPLRALLLAYGFARLLGRGDLPGHQRFNEGAVETDPAHCAHAAAESIVRGASVVAVARQLEDLESSVDHFSAHYPTSHCDPSLKKIYETSATQRDAATQLRARATR